MTDMIYDEHYVEVPILTNLDACAVSFVFSLPSQAAESRSEHIRLEPLLNVIRNRQGALYDDLIEPIDSFMADITHREGAWRRRPLVMMAEPGSDDAPHRTLTIERPTDFSYDAEGRHVALEPCVRTRTMDYREAFVVFASGRIMYVLTLVPGIEDGHAAVDEYLLIQLEKLVNPTEDTEALRRSLIFREPGGEALDLLRFVRARLDRLAADKRATNAVSGILLPYVLGKDPAALDLDWKDLRALQMAIESTPLVELIHQSVDGLARIENEPGRAPEHLPADLDERTGALLVAAGLVQGVMDFPFQDRDEIEDSLEPVDQGDSFVAYSHPAFMVMLQKEWRSLRQMRPTLGTCPYMLLTQVVFLHNELIVEAAEAEVERLIYARTRRRRRGGADDQDIRAVPLGDLSSFVRINVLNQGAEEKALARNLDQRLSIHRRLTSSWIPNQFRYRMERDLLDAIFKRRALSDRLESTTSLLDQYHSLTNDAYSLMQAVASRRTNMVLFVIALLGLVGVVKTVVGFFSSGAFGP